MLSKKGFTLIELMVVILIVGILAAVAVPIMRGRIDSAKWSEANACAGSIRTAVRAYVAEKGPSYDSYADDVEGTLDSVYETLGFSSTDLDGAYFNQEDYEISDVDGDTGVCTVTVETSHDSGPSGTGTLSTAGAWSVAAAEE